MDASLYLLLTHTASPLNFLFYLLSHWRCLKLSASAASLLRGDYLDPFPPGKLVTACKQVCVSL